MDTIKFYIRIADAVNYLRDNFNISVEPLVNGLQGFDYAPQSVFQLGLDPMIFESLRLNTQWFTRNDVIVSGSQLPNLHIVNPRTPETSSLVRVVSGDDSRVRYTNVFDTNQEVFETTNRQFTLNSIPV